MTTKTERQQMTIEAQNGFDRINSPAYYSSSNWMLHNAGRLLDERGYTKPIAAWVSKGYSVRLQTAANEFIVKFEGKDLTPTIERLG